MNSPVVSIQDLTYRYRGQNRQALDHVSIDVAHGDFLVIMGPTEAGKSTLASTINGLIPHFFRGSLSGVVSVLGRRTTETSVADLTGEVGMVFQDFEAQLFSTNVELEVAFGPENLGLPRAEIRRRVDENLKLVGLASLGSRAPATLSGGQKQKLAIASVLALQPKVLVMDEPTTDLDPASKKEIFRITDELRRREDVTLIAVEHETEEVLNAKHVLLLEEGRIVTYGPSAEILKQVDLLQEIGVMPAAIPAYFHRIGSRSLPLTLEEGLTAFAEQGLSIDDAAHARSVEAESRRSSRYGETVISCQDLDYTYAGGVHALNKINLEIRRGEMVAIVGQNGGGKTTLAKHFNGLLRPGGGSVSVGGMSTEEQSLFQLGQKVAYVFQNPDHQIFSDTVFGEVAFGLRQRHTDEAAIRRRVESALESCGLNGFESEDPFVLTKSGRKRVAVASVLALEPDVLILDEPTTGLDYLEQRSMMNLVKQLNEQGRTIIFITHHMWVVAEYAHRVVVVNDGRIMLDGTPREIFVSRELDRAALKPPQAVAFSTALGKTMLSVNELVSCTRTKGARP